MNKLYLIKPEVYLKEFSDDTVLQYDAMKFTVALQGVLNREIPLIYLLWQESDYFWLEYMSGEGKILNGRETIEISTFDEFLDTFSDEIRRCGIALWDSDVPATMNVASTACGVEDVLPIRYTDDNNGIACRVINKTGAEVKLDLHGKFTGCGIIDGTNRKSTGSAKCDAYIWALETYLDRTNPYLLFYNLDAASWAEDRLYYPDLGNAFVYNHDYAISKRAFIFDVSSYDDELPCDDKTQPLGTDLATMKEILLRQYKRTDGKKMITICGFNPWQQKYTDFGGKGKHGGVDAEWRFTEILSAYNCIKDADAYGYCGLANASVFTHYPLKEKYKNPAPKPEVEYDPNKTYILFYVGDYDAAAWTCRFIPKWYKDEALGKNPLMWCFNQNLSDRIPQAFDFIYENYTDNDYFEAGDSGAGYNNPYLLYPPRIHSDLPSGADAYVEHNKYYFNKFDNHCIGFVINGVYPTTENQMHDIAKFADWGVGYNGYGQPTKVVDGTVFMPHTADICAESSSVEKAVADALAFIDKSPANKRFHIFRTILTSPSHHDKILTELKKARPEANFELLDPYNFFRLAKYAVENNLTY